MFPYSKLVRFNNIAPSPLKGLLILSEEQLRMIFFWDPLGLGGPAVKDSVPGPGLG